MPYNKKDFKVSYVNYLNKDFDSFKSSLIEYAKAYFPDTYKDFNETSPGMMLIEMAAYVGDVMSFYVEQQYKEMMISLSQEIRNIINIANMLGYKVKPTTPSITTLQITQEVSANKNDLNNIKPDFTEAITVAAGLTTTSNTDSNIVFQTIDVTDFTISGSSEAENQPVPSSFDSDGLVSKYTLTRNVKAMSVQTKVKTFNVGSPTKFLRLTIPDDNVVDILSVVDEASGNKWYEVEYLAQDRVPIDNHYTDDGNRETAYSFGDGTSITSDPVPYSLKYIQTSKKFSTEVNVNGLTSLVFGNGVLRNQETTLNDINILDHAGITLPDNAHNNIDVNIDPLNVDDRLTLGETPFNTTIRVIYRVGGGLNSNVSSGDLTDIDSYTLLKGESSGKNLTIQNITPATGGQGQQSTEDIRRAAKAYFAAQNRCVTKEDYEARTLALPSKYGGVAKVYCRRSGLAIETSSTQELINNLDLNIDDYINTTDSTDLANSIQAFKDNGGHSVIAEDDTLSGYLNNLNTFYTNYGNLVSEINTNDDRLATIDLYILTYDHNKHLIPALNNNSTIHPLKQNIKNYLENYRMVTDVVNVDDGKIINFGVAFEVFAHRDANKSAVKLACIETIKDYFNIDKLFFKDTIHSNDLYYELMGIDGVRSVSYVELTQDFSNLSNGRVVNNIDDAVKLWDYDATTCSSGDISSCTAQNTGLYNFKYDFEQFYINNEVASGEESEYFVSDGVILPSISPSVFELKYPNQNIRGVVR